MPRARTRRTGGKSAAIDPANQDILDNIAVHGWHCALVASRVEDAVQTTFAYSVGLETTFGWPELICFGLRLELLPVILSGAVEEIRDNDLKPKAGLLLREVMRDYPCRLDPFPLAAHRDHLGRAIWLAEHQGRDPYKIRCLQLVWPDRQGRFPDDEACNAEVRALQRPIIGNA